MSSPVIQMNAIDGVWVRQMYFVAAGDVMEGHMHNHNHITLLSAGAVKVTVNGQVSEFTAPHMIFIHKDHEHTIEALQDGTLAYCIHAIRDAETGEIIDGLAVPEGVKIEPMRV